MIFDKYPYTNFHEMNDDWIIQTLKMMDSKLDEFVAMNSLTYADPIEYDIGTAYPANTVVIYNDTAYVSKQAVGAGVLPTVGGDYWLAIFPFGEMFNQYETSTYDVLSARVDAALEAAAVQLNSAIDTIPSIVNQWLAEHPNVTTSVQPNSISFQKFIEGLKKIQMIGYDKVEEVPLESADFEQGGINGTTGAEMTSEFSCRTGYITFDEAGIVKIGCLGGYEIFVYEYDNDETYIGLQTNDIGPQISAFAADPQHKYRFTIYNLATPVDPLTPEDLPFGAIMYELYVPHYVTYNDLDTSVPVKFRWETGSIGSTGNNSGSNNTTRMRTVDKTKINASSFTLTVPIGYVALYYIYDNTQTFVSRSANVRETTVTADITPGYYIRILAYNVSQTDVSPAEGNNITVVYDEQYLDAIADDNYTIDENASLSLFESMGVIGDSWASGSLKNPTTGEHVTTNYAVSWPQILGRRTGIDVYNYSAGGLSTRTWLTYALRGLPKLMEDEPRNLYVINLGINDNTAIVAGTEALGTIADVNVADFTQNPDTFYGNYGKIIGSILAYAPSAKIICMSIARPGERNMDVHIKAIADLYGVPYVQLTDDSYFSSTLFNSAIVNGHPLAYGYNGMSCAIERLLIKCLTGNQYYFANYTGEIPTP